MKDALMLLRPLQWIKNTFVFAPLFFSNNLLNKEYFMQTLWTFLAFCLVSSSIYCFNDIHDVESDRQHPKKRFRPIAAGKVSIWEGYFIMILCLIGCTACHPESQCQYAHPLCPAVRLLGDEYRLLCPTETTCYP